MTDSAEDYAIRFATTTKGAVGPMIVIHHPKYLCPVHGEVTEVIIFPGDFSENRQYVCMRCVREYLIARFGTVKRIPEEDYLKD